MDAREPRLVSAGPFHWNDRNTAFLRKHWSSESASWIAKRLGCSRSAVIGKGYRLHLPHKRGETKVHAGGFKWIVHEPDPRRPLPYRPGIDPRPERYQRASQAA